MWSRGAAGTGVERPHTLRLGRVAIPPSWPDGCVHRTLYGGVLGSTYGEATRGDRQDSREAGNVVADSTPVHPMPIDLSIRDLAHRAHEAGRPAFEAAVARREEVAAELDALAGEGAAAAVIGGVPRPAPEGPPLDPDVARPVLRLTEAQEAVRDAWAAMHPPDACWTDTYNVQNLLHQLGLSWEEPPVSDCYQRVLLGAAGVDGAGDGLELTEMPVLRGDGLRALIAIIESRPVPSAERIANDLAASHGFRGLGEVMTRGVMAAIDEVAESVGADPSTVRLQPGVGAAAPLDDGANSPEAWRAYFVQRRESLLGFLRAALEGGHEVVVSY